MKIRTKMARLSMIIGGSLFASTLSVSANQSASVTVLNTTNNGSPTYVVGNLGSMNQKSAVASLKHILTSQVAYNATGNEDFTIIRQWVDHLGKSHTHFTQSINGIEVYGTSLIMHANITNPGINSLNASSQVYSITGNLAVDATPSQTLMSNANNDNGAQALASAKMIGKVKSKPKLAYIYLPLKDQTKLAWRMEVSWDHGGNDFGRDFVYFDVNTGDLLTRHAQVHSAKSWRTHTLNGGSQSSAPGTLLCTNNQSCGGNAAAQRAHDGAAKVYDYYLSKFNRDSLNNNGMTLISSVDLGDQNAYWTGYQMLYGGAISGMNDFTSDFDVIGHELTHGVTQHTANLVYANASGALNEAWSDIMGLSAEAYKNGTTSSTWLLGDGLYNTPGKAMRYMNNPTQDNYSKDWWPERIPYVSNPNNGNDNGGVHGNSGIANLAYVLLVDGGSHPRNKSPVQVPGIGMAKAEQIFYRALNTYMNQSTNFAGARAATESAAQDLYGATEKTAVSKAWCAVGVGACPGDVIVDKELVNGVAATNIGASTGSEVVYTLEVPAGATDISFASSGGSGDADMYVKFGSTPTDNSWDCRPYKNGNTESCTGSSTGGKYYVRLKAYSTFSGVSLTGSYTSGGTNPPINDTVSNISVAQGQWAHYTQELAAGYTNMTVTISGGSGDIDLYVRHGAQSTGTIYNCRPYLDGNNESCTFNAPAAGTWYLDLYGYSAASGVTLNLTANP